MPSADTELMFAYVRRGDDNALAALVERHSVWLTAFLKGMLPAKDVEDAFQQVWFRVIRLSASYNGGDVKAYLLRTARNVSINILDNAQPTESIDDERFASDEIESDARTPPEFVEATELAANVAEAVHSLPLREREIILLRIEGELSMEEIAKEIGVPFETVRSRARSARQRLKQLLGEKT